MNFETRVQRAIARGRKSICSQTDSVLDSGCSSSKLRQQEYAVLRDDLINHLEICLEGVIKYLSEFRMQTIVAERGWGARLVAVHPFSKSRTNSTPQTSSLEMLVPPIQSKPMVAVRSMATVKGENVFLRTHFQPLQSVDFISPCRSIEKWCLEFVELYASLS